MNLQQAKAKAKQLSYDNQCSMYVYKLKNVENEYTTIQDHSITYEITGFTNGIEHEPNAYHKRGFANRMEYLKHVAQEHSVNLRDLYNIALLLGPEEDFDGLIVSAQDDLPQWSVSL